MPQAAFWALSVPWHDDIFDYIHANCLKSSKYLNYFAAAILSNLFEDVPGKVHFLSDLEKYPKWKPWFGFLFVKSVHEWKLQLRVYKETTRNLKRQ